MNFVHSVAFLQLVLWLAVIMNCYFLLRLPANSHCLSLPSHMAGQDSLVKASLSHHNHKAHLLQITSARQQSPPRVGSLNEPIKREVEK